jgi:hypothetical protein
MDENQSANALIWEPLIRFIASEIEHGRPVFLGVPAALGYERRKIFLNHLLAQAVASRDRTLMVHGVASAFQMGARDATKEKTVFD